MGLRIQNNIAAMNAHRQLTLTDSMMTKSLERLSSGYRINRAADDAAGLAISQSFRADIASDKVAGRNVSEANSMLQVAEGAYDQIGNMLVRLKELATQAASANAGSNLDKINAEGNALVSEIDRISNSTEYAGTKLLDGTFGNVSGGFNNSIATGSSVVKVINTDNGELYDLANFTGITRTRLTFDFSNETAPIPTDIYSISVAPDNKTVTMTGASNTITGTISGKTLTLSNRLVITGDSDLQASDFDRGTFGSFNVGLTNLQTESNAVSGTYTITQVTKNEVTITNDADSSITQTITGVSGGQTVNFDELGIKFDLGNAYDTSPGLPITELHLTVSNDGTSAFQIGSKNTANDRIDMSLSAATTNVLGISADQMLSASDAQGFLDSIDSAIDALNSARGGIGALQNRLGYASANLATTIENTQAAESVIRDVDMADEMTTFTKDQILMQAGTAMLAQANQAPQQILSLFR